MSNEPLEPGFEEISYAAEFPETAWPALRRDSRVYLVHGAWYGELRGSTLLIHRTAECQYRVELAQEDGRIVVKLASARRSESGQSEEDRIRLLDFIIRRGILGEDMPYPSTSSDACGAEGSSA